MPIIPHSGFRPPLLLKCGHCQTLIPYLFRKVKLNRQTRERLELEDGDFLDADWYGKGNSKLIIVSHGMEGNSTRPYVLGMIRAFNEKGWDGLAWNFRGCSGSPNRLSCTYHNGSSDDLAEMVKYAVTKGYKTIALIGFSLGGNILLNYMGKKSGPLPPQVKVAVALSVPCHLASSSIRFNRPDNRIYFWRFIHSFKNKLSVQAKNFPELISMKHFKTIKSFEDFDNCYTAPLNGFESASQYYQTCSSIQRLKNITVPTLLINALNDPFLTKECFPVKQARKNSMFWLETPASGGHVGFWAGFDHRFLWSEKRTIDFIESHL